MCCWCIDGFFLGTPFGMVAEKLYSTFDPATDNKITQQDQETVQAYSWQNTVMQIPHKAACCLMCCGGTLYGV